MSDDLRVFLGLARRSRDLGTVYPGAQLRGFPVPHLDFRGCADPILQYLRYFADHPGPTNGPNFSHGLSVYTKEHEHDD
jgi:hypothetical protein